MKTLVIQAILSAMGVLVVLALALAVTSCSASRPTYRGFRGPAYLPTTTWRPAHRKI